MEMVIIGIGGMVGSVVRYSLHKWTRQIWPNKAIYATMFVNLTGSLTLGFLSVLFLKWSTNESIRLLISMGFLGAYTTYSTFSYETINLFITGKRKNALFYFVSTLCFGLVAAFFGVYMGKLVID